MHVVLVVGGDLNDVTPARGMKTGVRAHDDQRGSRRDESVKELLRPCQVDIPWTLGRGFAAVPPRVVDVDVAPVLM